IAEDLTLKRLRFGDILQEQAHDSGAEDAAAQFDADFAILSMELARPLPQILDAFGGEDDSALLNASSDALSQIWKKVNRLLVHSSLIPQALSPGARVELIRPRLSA